MLEPHNPENYMVIKNTKITLSCLLPTRCKLPSTNNKQQIHIIILATYNLLYNLTFCSLHNLLKLNFWFYQIALTSVTSDSFQPYFYLIDFFPGLVTLETDLYFGGYNLNLWVFQVNIYFVLSLLHGNLSSLNISNFDTKSLGISGLGISGVSLNCLFIHLLGFYFLLVLTTDINTP